LSDLTVGVNDVEGYDPVEVSLHIYPKVCKRVGNVELRRYYRFRGGRWYGGIATADVIGCNLSCRFCWSWRFRSNYSLGVFYEPLEVYNKLLRIAKDYGYRYVRLSGAEPTISKDHLISLLDLFSDSKLVFILETNGILIGSDESYAKELAKYDNLVVRVSFKGTTPEEFNLLTGARPEFFNLQFKALINLINAGFRAGKDVYAAAMIGFSSDESIVKFVKELKSIDPGLVDVDWEYVILYPHVEVLLRRYGLKPLRFVNPNSIPREMI
jgi:uncharacterized Fe-S cluster-containing radical SAM superfamily protein